MTSPTFTDSPEDLITRARRIAQDGKVRISEKESLPVPPGACLLLSDLARAFEVERQSRSSGYAGFRAQNIALAEMESAAKKAIRFSRVLAALVVVLMVINAILVAHR